MTIERFDERSVTEPMPIERSTWHPIIGTRSGGPNDAGAGRGRHSVSHGSNVLTFTSRNLHSGRGLRHVRIASLSVGTVDLTLVFDPTKAITTHLFVTGKSSGMKQSGNDGRLGNEAAARSDFSTPGDNRQRTRDLLLKVAAGLSSELLRETLSFLSPTLPEERPERHGARGRIESGRADSPGATEDYFANQVMRLQNVLSTGTAAAGLTHSVERTASALPSGGAVTRHTAGPADRVDVPRPGDPAGDPGALLDMVDRAARAIWTEVSGDGKAVGSAIGQAATAVGSTVSDAASSVGDAIGDILSPVGDAVKTAYDSIRDYVSENVGPVKIDGTPAPAKPDDLSPITNDPSVGKDNSTTELGVGSVWGDRVTIGYATQDTGAFDSHGQPGTAKMGVLKIYLDGDPQSAPDAPKNYSTPYLDPPIKYDDIGSLVPGTRPEDLFGLTPDSGKYGDLNLNLPQISFETSDTATDAGGAEVRSSDESNQPAAGGRTGDTGTEGPVGTPGDSASPHEEMGPPAPESRQPTDPSHDPANDSGGSSGGSTGGSTGTGPSTDEHDDE
jgi:hypothetical protein